MDETISLYVRHFTGKRRKGYLRRRSVTQAAIHRFLCSQARVQSQYSSCGLNREQSGSGSHFPPSISFLHCQCYYYYYY